MGTKVTRYGKSTSETLWIVEVDGIVAGTLRKARDTRTDKHATSARLIRGWDATGCAIDEHVGNYWTQAEAVSAIVARHDFRDPAELAAMRARQIPVPAAA